MPANNRDPVVAQFLRVHYIQWAVGQLEPSLARELDDLSPVGWENWKTTLERVNGLDAARLRGLHTLLCDTLGYSNDEALCVMFRAE